MTQKPTTPRGSHMDPTLDLTLAIKTLHQLALEEGDLGYEYWYRVRKLLESACSMAARIDELESRIRSLEANGADVNAPHGSATDQPRPE